MQIEIRIFDDGLGPLATAEIYRNGQTSAVRSAKGREQIRDLANFCRDVTSALARDPDATVVVVPRNRWLRGPTAAREHGKFYDPDTGQLCALGWACVALELPPSLLADVDHLDKLRTKLRDQGRDLPPELQRVWNDADAEDAILRANDGAGAVTPFDSEPQPIASSLCEKQVAAAGAPVHLAFVFVDD